MSDIQFRFCDFKQDLIERVLEDQPLHSTLFIFPTRASQARGTRQAQQQWAFETTDFITMEDLKESLFFSPAPLLKEEKRRIAFFASLSETHRKTLKIFNYFQSRQAAREFFNLWEEFNEELVKDPVDTEKLRSRDAELLDWQIKTLDHFTAIRNDYKDFIRSRDFSDRIFTFKPENIRLQGLGPFRRTVFVNQFYYTKLEKRLIDDMAKAGFEIFIYFQLPEKFVVQKDLAIKSFDLPALKPFKTQNIHIFKSANDFAMITSLFTCLANNQVDAVIDDAFSQKPYAAFFSRGRFNLSVSKSFRTTSIFRFFSAVAHLVGGIIWEPGQGNVLLPLQNLLDAAVCGDFFSYFAKGPGLQQKLLEYIDTLAENDYKYIYLQDKPGIPVNDDRINTLLQKIITFCRQMGQIKTIKEFIQFIDTPDGIMIKNIVTRDERLHSDILDVFYRLLSDFSSLENPALVRNWQDFFTGKHHRIKGYTIAGSLVKLFLEYVQQRRIRLTFKKPNMDRLDVTDLQDTRNISFRSVAVLNVIEGQIPHASRIQFLFTEKQRSVLGLKTWEDVRLWEKYYFYRLVLSTPNVFLFTQQNTDQNIDPSSFVEELLLSMPAKVIKEQTTGDHHYFSVYSRLLDCRDHRPDISRTRQNDFYALQPDMDKIWPGRTVKLHYYPWKDMKENHFEYYIRHIAGLCERHQYIKEEFSPKLLGNIIHDIFTEVWNKLIVNNVGMLFGYDFDIPEKLIHKAIDRIPSTSNYYLRLPQNYSLIYFDKILRHFIVQAVLYFFTRLKSLKLDKKKIDVFPEKEYATTEEKKYKVLLDAGENSDGFSVHIRGRADLRIEVPEEERHFIIDYKTGNYQDEQLLFYELFYYLLDNPARHVKSMFMDVFKTSLVDMKDHKKPKSELRMELQRSIIEHLRLVYENGFHLEGKIDGLYTEITRADLYKMLRTDEAI